MLLFWYAGGLLAEDFLLAAIKHGTVSSEHLAASWEHGMQGLTFLASLCCWLRHNTTFTTRFCGRFAATAKQAGQTLEDMCHSLQRSWRHSQHCCILVAWTNIEILYDAPALYSSMTSPSFLGLRCLPPVTFTVAFCGGPAGTPGTRPLRHVSDGDRSWSFRLLKCSTSAIAPAQRPGGAGHFPQQVPHLRWKTPPDAAGSKLLTAAHLE